MNFDVNAARSAGYSDDEIADFLAKENNFDLAGAVSSGYSASEVVSFLTQAPAPEPAPQADAGVSASDGGRYDLPRTIEPSRAGGGRGFVNPPMASEAQPRRVSIKADERALQMYDDIDAGKGRSGMSAYEYRGASPEKKRQLREQSGQVFQTRGEAPAPAATKPEQKPYKNRVEALDDAINFLEEGANKEQVLEAFGKAGITWDEITRHGIANKREYFQQRPADMGIVAPQRLMGGEAVPGEIKAWEPTVGQGIVNTAVRGIEGAGRTIDIVRNRAGLMMPDDVLADRIAQRQRRIGAAMPGSETQQGMQEIGDANEKGFLEAASAIARNPVAGISMLAESVIASSPAVALSIGGSVLGPAGATAGGFAGGMAMEYGSTIYDTMVDAGMNPASPQDVARALADKDLMARAEKRGEARGITIGAFSALTSGVAAGLGRSIKAAVEAGNVGRAAGLAATAGGVGVVGDGFGEYAAQKAVGDKTKYADILMEAAAGLPGALGDAGGAAVGAALRSERSAPEDRLPAVVNFTPADSPTKLAGLPDIVAPIPDQGAPDASPTGPVQPATAGRIEPRGLIGGASVEPSVLAGLDPIGDVRPGADGMAPVDGAARAVGDAGAQRPAPVTGDPLKRSTDTNLLARAEAAAPEGAVLAEEPWRGRSKEGFATKGDAAVSLVTRVQRNPDWQWRIEEMPNGRFQLAGYVQAPTQQTAPQAPAQAPAPAGPELTGLEFVKDPITALKTAQKITFAPGQMGAVKLGDRVWLNQDFSMEEMDDGTTVFTRTAVPAGAPAVAGSVGQRGAQTTPTASQQSIVMSSLNRAPGKRFVAVGSNTENSGIAQRIAAAFGRPIMFVKERSNNAGFSALFYPDMGVIVANAEGRRPMYAAVTHEVFHGLPDDLRQRVVDAVMQTVTPAQRADFLAAFDVYQKAGTKMQDEELTARIIEQDAENPQFWQKLADRMGDSEFAKLAREILGMLDRLLAGFTREDSSEFTSDIERVRDVVADAYAEAQARLGGEQAPATQQAPAKQQAAAPVKQTESIVDGVKYSADRRNLMDAPTIDIQSLVGKRVFGIKADLLDAGRSYTGIDGSQLEFPIEMLGGPGFPRLPENMASGVVWAVRGGAVLSKIQKKVESTDYVLVHAMNDNSHLTNTTASTAYIKTVEAYLRDGRISKDNLLALDQIVRDPKNQLSLPDFPGFEAPNIIEYIDGLSFDQRGALAKMLEKKEAQQHGLPNLERFRRETIDPEFVGYRQGDAMLVLEVDKTNPVVKLGEDGTKMHPSYPLGIKGRIVGKLAKGVNYDVIYRDYFRDTVPSFKNGMDGAWYGFDRVIPEQEITQDIANSVSPGGYKAIRNARQAEASLAFANGNWLESGRTKAQGGVSVQEFVDALRANDGAAALTMYDPSEVKAGIKDGSFRVFQLGTQGGDKGLQVFFGLKRGAPWYKDMIDGVGDNEVEVVSVTNNEKGAPGVGVPAIITKAIQEGATVLDAFAVKSERFPDGFLPEMYGQFGFEEIGRIPFDPSYYDDIQMSDLKAFWKSGGWKDSDGYPDVVVMRWKGKDEDRAGTVDRYVRTGETGVSTRAARHLRSAAGDAGGQRNRPGAPQGRTRGADGAQARGDQGAGNAAPVVRRAYGSIQEIASLSDGDIRNLGLDPAEVSRLRAKLESPDSAAASPTSVVLYSADRDRSPADRIRWRKLTDVKSDVSLDRIPAHITPFANFMRDMAVKANAGGLTSRDLIKAYTIARSSMNRGAVNTAKAVAAGLQLPTNFTDAKIRPEGAFGYWLLSPVGQGYLNAAEIGVTDQAAIADAVKTMAPFGTQNTLGGDLERAASGMLHSRLPAMTKAIVKAAEGKNAVKDWQEATADIYGVREAKKGFLGSLLGFGQLPTFDARQINLNVAADSKEDTLKALSSTKARDVVAKLARRMDALQLAVDPEFSPFYRHLAHHAVWDAVGGTQTTHSDVIDAMVMASADRTSGRLDGIEAYHYSKASRQSLSSSSFGTGLQGSARDEYFNATDPRRRQRISFYVNKGTGVRPEAGVGGFAHRATLDNIYDANSDPQNLRKGGQAAFESAVLDAGFDGYLDRLEGDQPGQVILLGQRTVNVTPIGPRTRIDDAKPVPAAAARKTTREEGGVVVRRPDGQQMMGVIRAMPALRTAAPSFKLQYGEARVDRSEAEAANAALREAGTDFQFEVAAPMASADRTVTETPEFKRWFGDSKVVDADGNPLVVYHGTRFDFAQFDGYEVTGWFSETPDLANERYAFGESDDAGANVMPVYLSIKNPKALEGDMDDAGADGNPMFEQINNAEYVAKLIRQGHDGIVVNEDGRRTYAAFRPEQIKSAIGNNGQFDPENPDIRMSARRSVADQIAYQGYEPAEVPRVQGARRMASIVAKLDAGELTEKEFEFEVRYLANRMAQASDVKRANRVMRERERGADIIREKLIAARRRGDIDPDVTEFALWALDQNPAIANNLGISVREQPEGQRGVSGEYNPAAEVMRVFKGAANTTTAVHEILHHTERMMPADVQSNIRREWGQAYAKALAKADGKQREALEKMLDAMAGSAQARKDVQRAFSDGTLDYDAHYQLVNPSEFWAVNATRIMAVRFEADSWVGNAKQWLGEMLQKVKGLLRLRSDAPILEGLQAVLDGTGERLSPKMLAEGDVFNDVSASARRSQPIQGQRFTLPDTDRTDAARIKLQDDALRMRRVIEAVQSQGGTVNEEQNFYDANTLMPGRVQAMMDDFRDDVIKPMIEKAAKAGIDMEELSLYAYAKHAEERNDYIASINPRMPDGGSGMMTVDANKILADVAGSGKQADYDALHADLMSITETTRRVLLDEGLITQEQFDAMEQQYGNYIPLRGFENVDAETGAIRPGIGRGINVRGKETIKALGRRSRAGDLIENVIRDYQRAVVRSEKNNVGKVLLDFVLSNPDPDLWGVDVDKTSASYNKAQGIVQYTKAIDKGEDTIGVKVGGTQVYIKLADKALTRALKQTFKEEVGDLERVAVAVSGWYTTLMRNVLTRYNPPFAMVNAIRDSQSGLLAATDELGAKGAARFSAHLPKAIAATTADETGWKSLSNPLTQQYLREFKAAGALTGGFYMRNLEDITKDLRNDLLKAGATPRTVSEKVKFNVATKGAYLAATKFLRALELAGAASENATRLALYMAARDMGKTPAQAALLAKNGTTNFNRKGEWGGALNAAYLFFNAAVQGNAQLIKTLKNPKVLAGLGAFAGAAMAMAFYGAAAGGEDDDGEKYWDKIPSYEKERNLIIMLAPGDTIGRGIDRVGKRGRYIKIPVQYGINFFPNLGYALSDVIRNAADPRQGKTPAKTGMHLASVFFGSMNPFGGALDLTDSVSVAMAVAPTVVDLPIQIGTERNSFGTPTAPFKMPRDNTPDSERMFVSQMGGVPEWLAKTMNELGGGNEKKPGKILGVETSVTPGTIKTIIAGTTGGLGTFFDQVITAGSGMASPDKAVKASNIPFLNKVYGEVEDGVNIRSANERMREVRQTAALVKAQVQDGIDPKMDSDEKRLVSIASAQETFDEESARLRKEEIAIMRSTTMTDEQKRLARDNIQAARDRMSTAVNRVYLDSLVGQRGSDQ